MITTKLKGTIFGHYVPDEEERQKRNILKILELHTHSYMKKNTVKSNQGHPFKQMIGIANEYHENKKLGYKGEEPAYWVPS